MDVKPNWERRLGRQVGRRGTALLIFTGLDLALAVFLLTLDSYPVDVRNSYAGQASLLPLTVWAYLWLAVAALMAFLAFSKNDRMAFFASAGAKLVWAGCFLVGYIYFDVGRAWLQAVLYFALASIMILISGWEENRGELPELTLPHEGVLP